VFAGGKFWKWTGISAGSGPVRQCPDDTGHNSLLSYNPSPALRAPYYLDRLGSKPSSRGFRFEYLHPSSSPATPSQARAPNQSMPVHTFRLTIFCFADEQILNVEPDTTCICCSADSKSFPFSITLWLLPYKAVIWPDQLPPPKVLFQSRFLGLFCRFWTRATRPWTTMPSNFCISKYTTKKRIANPCVSTCMHEEGRGEPSALRSTTRITRGWTVHRGNTMSGSEQTRKYQPYLIG
jgi:hypothetical protein